ncbi:MAG: M14 family zinc carboxypeptidase [Planctomycetota bacterium]
MTGKHPDCLHNDLRALLTGAERKRFDWAPAFWRASLADVDDALASVRRGVVRRFGRTAGGRALRAVVYAPRRALATVAYLGGTHAEELAGVSGAINLISLLERGRDLAGRRRPALLDAARRLKIIVVPVLNADGLARLPARHFERMIPARMRQIALGIWKNGRVVHRAPVFRGGRNRRGDLAGRLANLKYLGMRFNDAGYRVCRPISPTESRSAETRALARFLRRERADFLLDVHCHASPPALFLPRAEDIGAGYADLRAMAEDMAVRVRRERAYGLGVAPAGGRKVMTNGIYLNRIAGVRTFLLELHYRYGDPVRGRMSAPEKQRIVRELDEQVDATLVVFQSLLQEQIERSIP